MQLGLIGLGRMGGNMRDRIRAAGHEVVGYDHHPDIRDAGSLAEMVGKLQAPRVVWTMVPAGQITESTIDELADLLSDGDLIIDGGNSKFTDDRPRAERLAAKGIGYMDCGVSGGIWGSQNGYALMVGGDAKHVQKAMPIFDALKPAGDFGFVHAGPVGAGHYTKMVHNGIEYGMMQALAEGWELLEASEYVENVPGAFKSWREGSVVKSWLLDRRRGGPAGRAAARHRGVVVHPFRVPADRLARHEGRRRAAPAVRWTRRPLISLICMYAGSS
jgi:6-phosphogluconate dehydrogenase